ncbi:MAG: HIT domain-containing protein [Deltaproteobacteria bacterium]|nr:HIT domain-containing protein [Deltaproteobacteria bacterium]
MRTLHAPWRINYILGPKDKGCFLCFKRSRGYQQRHLVLRETEACYVLLNKYPYSAAHLMVVPRRHVADLETFTPDELLDFIKLTRDTARVLKKAVGAHGLNLGANLGRAAGAGLEAHFHFHIVPRWNGDHNFMPVLGDTYVLPECLEETYRRLLPHFK